MGVDMAAPGVQRARLAAGLSRQPVFGDLFEGRDALRRNVDAFVALASSLRKCRVRQLLRIEAFPMAVRGRKSNLPSAVLKFSRVRHRSPFHLSIICDSLNKPRGRFADSHLATLPSCNRITRYADLARQSFLGQAELLSESSHLFRFHRDTSLICDTSRIAEFLATHNPPLRERALNVGRIEAHISSDHPLRDSVRTSLRCNPACFHLAK